MLITLIESRVKQLETDLSETFFNIELIKTDFQI